MGESGAGVSCGFLFLSLLGRRRSLLLSLLLSLDGPNLVRVMDSQHSVAARHNQEGGKQIPS